MLKHLCIALFFFICAASADAQIADPLDVPGAVIWLDGQDVNGTGVQPANGSLVSTWSDKSGSGNNVTATAALAPTFESTGFDGVNPGLRFSSGTKMSGGNIYGIANQPATTIFFVNANVTLTNNFSFNLNGDNTGTSSTNGRFSFHTPWGNSRVYYDAGGCCGATRLQGISPNGTTETTLYSAVNDQPGSSQFLRIDGNPFQSDSSAISPDVTGGIRIGSTSGRNYDGRFAEVVIYNRALSITEIQDVECYLLSKWKPSALPAICSPSISVSKTSSVWDSGSNPLFSLPMNDVVYIIDINHNSGVSLDNDSVFIVDNFPAELSFFNGDMNGAGAGTDPVTFNDSSSGLTFSYGSDVAYSDSVTAPTSFGACGYTPTPIGGYDANVRHICINPKGVFNSSSSFQLQYRAQIK